MKFLEVRSNGNYSELRQRDSMDESRVVDFDIGPGKNEFLRIYMPEIPDGLAEYQTHQRSEAHLQPDFMTLTLVALTNLGVLLTGEQNIKTGHNVYQPYQIARIFIPYAQIGCIETLDTQAAVNRLK